MTLLAKRYATALHMAAKAAGKVDAVLGDLAALHATMQDRTARALWLSPDVKAKDRQAIAAKLASGRSPLIANLLQLLLQRHRQEVLPDLQPAFRAQVMVERGEVEGTVETPRPLSADDLTAVQRLAERLCGKRCLLAVVVRPELIGGIRLIVGNVLYDGSVKSNLEQLEQRLLQVPV